MACVLAPRRYVQILALLLALTAVTVGVAFFDLGALNSVAAVAIAVAQAGLVLLFFMHARHSSHLTWLFIGAGVLWLALQLVFTLCDVLTRDWLPAPLGWS